MNSNYVLIMKKDKRIRIDMKERADCKEKYKNQKKNKKY